MLVYTEMVDACPIIYIHIQGYMTLALFETRSNYTGAGRWAAGTCLQVFIVPAGRFSAKASSTIGVTAALDGRMLNQQSVNTDPQISITHGR